MKEYSDIALHNNLARLQSVDNENTREAVRTSTAHPEKRSW